MRIEEQLRHLRNGLDIIVPAEGLAEKLRWSHETKKPLRIKLGFDPTAPDLHLGHAVVLKKLRQFQELGHTIVIIIGDFTASIGDPTGRNKTRPPCTQADIQANAATYLAQLSKILDISKTEVHANSEWLTPLDFRQILGLVSKVTISQLLQREDFKTRYEGNSPIYLHELLYPILQGYDSLMIEADVEMGGTDQLFNCLIGRDLQGLYTKPQQIVACTPLLKGTDGSQKMSKSLGNYIGLTESPNDMYGKVMSIPDSLIEEYACLVSTFSGSELKELRRQLVDGSVNPMESKKKLAHNIVEQFHGLAAADASADHFYRQIQSRDAELIHFTPVSLQSLGLSATGLTLLALCSALDPEKSKGELRRMIQQGGVTIHAEKITDPTLIIDQHLPQPIKLKLGKRTYYDITS